MNESELVRERDTLQHWWRLTSKVPLKILLLGDYASSRGRPIDRRHHRADANRDRQHSSYPKPLLTQCPYLETLMVIHVGSPTIVHFLPLLQCRPLNSSDAEVLTTGFVDDIMEYHYGLKSHNRTNCRRVEQLACDVTMEPPQFF